MCTSVYPSISGAGLIKLKPRLRRASILLLHLLGKHTHGNIFMSIEKGAFESPNFTFSDLL